MGRVLGRRGLAPATYKCDAYPRFYVTVPFVVPGRAETWSPPRLAQKRRLSRFSRAQAKNRLWVSAAGIMQVCLLPKIL
jgi:hypothetical protein